MASRLSGTHTIAAGGEAHDSGRNHQSACLCWQAQARNLFEVIGHLQRAEGLHFALSLKAAS